MNRAMALLEDSKLCQVDIPILEERDASYWRSEIEACLILLRALLE